MADVRRGEGLVEDERAAANPASTSPYFHSWVGLPSGIWPSPAAAKSAVGPFQLADDARRERVGAVVVGLALPDVAVGARVGTARPEALQADR